MQGKQKESRMWSQSHRMWSTYDNSAFDLLESVHHSTTAGKLIRPFSITSDSGRKFSCHTFSLSFPFLFLQPDDRGKHKLFTVKVGVFFP